VISDRFGGVAWRRARPESDGSTNSRDYFLFVDPSDPAALAGPQGGPAAEPSLSLCGYFFFVIFVAFAIFVVLRPFAGSRSQPKPAIDDDEVR
jgi:hypothetical protein